MDFSNPRHRMVASQDGCSKRSLFLRSLASSISKKLRR